MFHAEINNRPDEPMRFIQMWFFPSERGLEPSVGQKKVERVERTDRFLPLVSNEHMGALPIHSNAQVHSSFLQTGLTLDYEIRDWRGVYLYVLEGGPVQVNNHLVPALGAAKVVEETRLHVKAETNAELNINIEGSLEPELMVDISRRNSLSLPFHSVEEVRKAYKFTNLQSSLDIYYEGMCVLRQEQDFYDITWAYLLNRLKKFTPLYKQTGLVRDRDTFDRRGNPLLKI